MFPACRKRVSGEDIYDRPLTNTLPCATIIPVMEGYRMQKTREQIIHILKVHGESTVDALSQELDLTSVTVRHHLEILRREGLVAPPQALRRDGPGRPQYLYRLAEGAQEIFPSNYDLLASELLHEVSEALPPEAVHQTMERIAERLAERAELPDGVDFPTRLELAVRFLNEQGYMASVESNEGGKVVLHVQNCPYERVVRHSGMPCVMDHHLLTTLLQRDISHREHAEGSQHCVYTFNAPDSA